MVKNLKETSVLIWIWFWCLTYWQELSHVHFSFVEPLLLMLIVGVEDIFVCQFYGQERLLMDLFIYFCGWAKFRSTHCNFFLLMRNDFLEYINWKRHAKLWKLKLVNDSLSKKHYLCYMKSWGNSQYKSSVTTVVTKVLVTSNE